MHFRGGGVSEGDASLLCRCLGRLACRVEDHTSSPLVTSGSGDPGAASVTSATSHPAEFPTARTFYSGGSGSLRVNDSLLHLRSIHLFLYLPSAKAPHLYFGNLHRPLGTVSEPNDDDFCFC